MKDAPSRSAERPVQPLSDRVCDTICVAAAIWTVCCHAVIALGGSLHDLLATAALVGVAAVIATVRSRRRRNPAPPIPAATTQGRRPFVRPWESVAHPAGQSRTMPAARLVAVLAGAAALVLFATSENPVPLWLAAVAILFVGLTASWSASPQPGRLEPAKSTVHLERALWGIGFACVLLTSVCHRQDWDDSFYVNVAVAACDNPRDALMAFDTLYGVEGLSLHMPLYRVQSLELFHGAAAYLTGIPAIYCFHWITASVAALLVPLALARLFRILTPRYWLWSVVVVIVVLAGGGDVYRWYGNYAFVRMWVGKSIYLSILLPLAYAYGLRFGAAPSRRNWWLMAAVQIAAIGATCSSLWSVPMATCLGMACSVRRDRRMPKTLLIGVLASAYVVAVGLFFKGTITPGPAGFGAADRPLGYGLSFAFGKVLGGGRQELCALAAVMLAWTVCRRGPARRFAIVVPLVVLGLVMNPFWFEFLHRHLIGASYWRAMWALPVPILMALAVTAPLQWEGRRVARWSGRALVVAALVGFVFFAPRFSTLSRKNHNLLATPHLKVRWGGDHKWAKRLHAGVPSGSYVVAPWTVALWLPTFHNPVYPLIVRNNHYLGRIETELGLEELTYRLFMTRAVAPQGLTLIGPSTGVIDSANEEAIARLFRRGLEKYAVRGVCLSTSAKHVTTIRAALAASGFARTDGGQDVDIWVRS